jgi:hypothetical protein
MPTITITATLAYPSDAHDTHEEKQWFINTIIRNPRNVIYSPTLSQNIATIAVTSITTP